MRRLGEVPSGQPPQVLRQTFRKRPGWTVMVCNELDDGRKVSCFPVRAGYASTIPKVQGMTVPHITIWLDSIGCRAAAYVAMSRVKTDEDYLIAGGPLTVRHFMPAQ